MMRTDFNYMLMPTLRSTLGRVSLKGNALTSNPFNEHSSGHRQEIGGSWKVREVEVQK